MSKTIKVPDKMHYDSNTIITWLSRYGVPRKMMNDIRLALLYDAITEGDNIRYERVYSAIALMLREEFGFGQERITRGLRRFDNICGSVLGNDAVNWVDIEKRLKDETGIIIRLGDEGKRLIMEVER